MQLLRIKLNNWRGVEAAEIELDAGITIVEGDNEAGKSSFIEALNLLFKERDSTKKRDLKRVTPKGVDTGSQVEVELITGPYHLTYSKTFNKKTATTLFIHKPAVEQYVGTEAHEKVTAILDETIDFSLWQAIQLEQGGEFSQVNFVNSDSLAQALDNAAGGTGAGDGESALLDKAKKEYLKYFTEKSGKETGELASLRAQQSSLQQSGSALADSLAALESHVDESARIDEQLQVLQSALPKIQLTVVEYEKKRAEVLSQRQAVSACDAQVKTCELSLQEVERQIKERDQLTDEHLKLKKRIKEDSGLQVQFEESLAKVNAELNTATEERERLVKDRQQAEKALRAIESTVKLTDQKLQLQLLEQQHKQLQASYSELLALEAEVADIKVDDKAVNRIEKLEQARRERDLQLRGHSAKINLKILSDVLIEHGDTKRTYRAGEEVSIDASEKSSHTIADDVTLEVNPAADSYELSLQQQKTIQSLSTLLAECSVETVADAIALYRKKTELSGRLRELRRNYNEQTKDQSLDGLTAAVAACKKAIAQSESLSDATRELPQHTQQDFWRRLDDLEQSLKLARDHRDLIQQRCASAKTKLDVCVQSVAANKKLLADIEAKQDMLEQGTTYSQLTEAQAQALHELQKARSLQRSASDSMKDSQSGEIDLLVENARQSLQRAQKDLRELELSQADVRARLDQMQSEGLYEKHQQVLADQDDSSARLQQLNQRARAARLLWNTLSRHQREAQLSYARPLAMRVGEMGKVVFGADFSVELSESLNIVSRTMHGITVPFDDLSGGAREQLGILLRLAAAQLVSSHESMPLILDDTLGHTDSRRLETMGAILNGAARISQIVVMTCYPVRYSYVGGAKVVRLRPSSDALSVS